MKPITTYMSGVLLSVVLHLALGQDAKPIIQTGDIHFHQTIINGSNNTLVRK